jgi:hypothetical protein
MVDEETNYGHYQENLLNADPNNDRQGNINRSVKERQTQ